MNPFAVAAVVVLNNVPEKDRERALWAVLAVSLIMAGLVGLFAAALARLGA